MVLYQRLSVNIYIIITELSGMPSHNRLNLKMINFCKVCACAVEYMVSKVVKMDVFKTIRHTVSHKVGCGLF